MNSLATLQGLTKNIHSGRIGWGIKHQAEERRKIGGREEQERWKEATNTSRILLRGSTCNGHFLTEAAKMLCRDVKRDFAQAGATAIKWTVVWISV